MHSLKWLVLALILFSGCALLKREAGYVSLCLNDPVCYQAAYEKAKTTGALTTSLLSLSPAGGFSIVLGSVASYLGLLIFLRMGGKKKAASG